MVIGKPLSSDKQGKKGHNLDVGISGCNVYASLFRERQRYAFAALGN
jgi:hypothetical protein